MEESQKLFELLNNIIQQLPSLLTLLGCIVFVFIRWKRYPKVSLVLSGSLLFLFLHILVFATAFVWIPALLVERGVFQRYSFETIYTAMSLIYSMGLAIGFALMLVSVFMQRKRQVSGTI